MIIPDVNVLIHAYNSGSLHHKAAREWWEETLTLPRPVGLPWVSILGFVRIITRAAPAKNPLYPGEAIGVFHRMCFDTRRLSTCSNPESNST